MSHHTLFGKALRLNLIVLLVGTFAGGLTACNKKNGPTSGSTGDYSPQGSGSAPANPTGTFFYNLGTDPTTLNPISSTDLAASTVQGYILDSLAVRNEDTYEWQPALAVSWETKDNKVFTFKLRSGVKWHDGKPLTAEDVKFSFDVIFDPNYDTAHLRPYYEGLEKVEILDPETVRFTAKNDYFRNFDSAAGITVVPKHIYGVPEGKKVSKTLVGTGPYVLDLYERGNRLVLKNNPDWWGKKDPLYKGQYNFEKVIMRFVQENNVAVEKLKKGELDFMSFDEETYVKKTQGEEWGKEVFKVKTENAGPKGYGFIGWNLKKPIFQDRKVRVALAHAMNRKLMIEKFRYGMSEPATGPWHYQSIYASNNVKPISFDTKMSLKLLKEAGWSDSDKDGILDKKIAGKKTDFKITLMTASKDSLKYYTMYKEDAKQIGVHIDVKLLEWNTFIKLLDEGNFDAVALGWGGGAVDIDPKQIWHSDSAVKGGSNFISYRNPEVDKLIDEARVIVDRDQRAEKLKKAYELIAEDAPYLFLFNSKYTLYGHTRKMRRPKDTFKFTVGMNHWWIEKD